MVAGARGILLVALLSLPLLSPAATSTEAAPGTDPVARALDHLSRATPAAALAPYYVEAAATRDVDVRAWPSADGPLFSRLVPYDHSYGVEYSWLRLMHAVGSAGYDPSDVNGVDLTSLVLDALSDGDVVAGNVNDDMWAILALRAAGFPASDERVQRMADRIVAARGADGGWSHTNNALAASDTEITGMALSALRAAGRVTLDDERARLFLESADTGDGFGAKRGSPATCQTTAWAIHAYHALGREPPAHARRFLLSLQQPDGGFATSRSSTGSNLWCTAEAVPALAAGPPPFGILGRATVRAPAAIEAGAPTTLRVEGAFTEATWSVAGSTHRGVEATFSFAEPGVYAYSVLAKGAGTRAWIHGSLTVERPLPRVELALPPAQAWRHTPVTVDASTSTSPTGRLDRMEVDWGDGNRTLGASLVAAHAYEYPGARDVKVRVQDSSGAWSPPASFVVDVRNRAPVFDALPLRLVANRTGPFDVGARATDADGDSVTLRWRVDPHAREGDGPVDLAGLAPGEHALTFVATDAFGGAAYANLTLDVVNLPPVLLDVSVPREARAGEPFEYSARAVDADGPTPIVVWTFAGAPSEGASGNASLPAGSHAFEVRATDADGATRTLTGTVLVRDGQRAEGAAGPEALPPRVANLSAAFEGADLVVRFDQEPADALARIRWTSDAGEGAADAAGGLRVPLPDATHAEVYVEVATEGGNASAQAEARREVHASTLAPPRLGTPAPSARVGEAVRFIGEPPEGGPSLRFDFGDGLVTPWSATREVVHVYEAPGTYEVRLEARAADGRASATVVALDVLPKVSPVEPAWAFEEAEVVVVVVAPPSPPLAPTAELFTRSAPASGARPVPAPAAPWGLLALAGLAPLLGRATRRA